MEPVGRNRPCPCGSGKRYKECHGLVRSALREPALVPLPATDVQGGLDDAARLLDVGHINAAEAIARNALVANPQHAQALRLVGRSEYERGRPEEAVRLLLAAARAIPATTLPSSEQYRIWADLNFMLTQALFGLDGAFAAAKRAERARWLASLPDLQRDAAPVVSVVIVAGEDSLRLRAAVASVYAQTYRNLELVVVHSAANYAGSERIADMLAGCPFPYVLVGHGSAGEAESLNAGVRASSGEFVNALFADDEFAQERIRSFVETVANRGGAWGFGDVDLVEGEPMSGDKKAQATLALWRELLARVPNLDTVGYALIQLDCVVVTAANLFFSRDLFNRLGGFRALPHAHLWDFCLRAVWLEEPRFVASQLLRHRVTSAALRSSRKEFEASQVAMFGEFYERACDEQAVAPNVYAPCVHHWRAHFLKAPFLTGHVLMLGLDRVEAILGLLQQRSAEQRSRKLAPGINLVGFAFAEFGLGESLRALAHACAAGGIPFIVRDVDQQLNTRQADHRLTPYLADEMRHRCSLYCVNPDLMISVHGLLAAALAAGGYGIGFWYWELDRIPQQWKDALARLDEIWVATEFVAAAVRGATSKPVVKIAPPIEVHLSRRYARSDFALPDDCFLFLFSFDYNSFPKRKNPDGAIAAFRRAFSNRRDVGLVLKSINGKHHVERFAEMRDLVGDDDRIVLLDAFLTRDEVLGLQSVADAFVSLHRSEGLGLGLAESMYQGKPVIGTRYSGNLEFMNDENSCLVDCELVPVGKGEYLYDDERFHWAQPDVDQAADCMRRLVDDTDFRQRIARNGQQAIRTRFTPAATAALIRERLGTLGLI
jgi:glycosyltransferase involved in cell wall biosynthesis